MRPATADPRSLVGITLGLMLSVISAEATGTETCGAPMPTSKVEGSTFVLLVGYPRATTEPDLPELSAVGDDVLRMMQFFEPLRPDAVRVHLERSPRIDARLGERVRPPTLSAIERSVDDLIAEMRTAPEPRRIYVYYAGHGQQGWSSGRPRTRLFLAPDTATAGPGADGVLESNLLANRILAPLGRYGTVHFIADACQSWFLLEVRGVTRRVRVHKRRPVDAPQMTHAFSRQLPTVGALLATNGTQVTYEDPSLGGLFSHALRSAALGPGDLNGDGRITYRELDYGIEWILGGRAGSTTPGLHPPGGADDAVFVDWTAAPDAVPVCFEPGQGRYQLLSEDYGPLATVHAGDRAVNAWLTAGTQIFAFGRREPSDQDAWWTVAVDATTFALARRQPATQPLETRGSRFNGLFAQPLEATTTAPTIDATMPWNPRSYLGIGAQAGLIFPVSGAPGVEQAPTAGLGLRLGQGRHQLLVDLHWSQWRGETTDAVFQRGDCPPDCPDDARMTGETGEADQEPGSGTTDDPTQPFMLDRVGLLAGYGFVLWDDAVDLAVVGHLGGSAAIKAATETSPRRTTGSVDGRLGLMLHWPLPAGSPLAARIDTHLGYHGLVIDRAVESRMPRAPDFALDHAFSVGISIGLEWEEPL